MAEKTLNDKILSLAEKVISFTTQDVLVLVDQAYSRQMVSQNLRQLVLDRRLFRTGSTRGARYSLPHKAHLLFPSFEKFFKNQGQDEVDIWEEFEKKLPQIDSLPVLARRILVYTFTEILNNALNHSQSNVIKVSVSLQENEIEVNIFDDGIGIFRNIMQKFSYVSELESMQQLMKGKLTTDPKNHTGEGVFFSSKAADSFMVESYEYTLLVDNKKPDVAFFPTQHKPTKGTKVQFTIQKDTPIQLKDVFLQYQTEGVGGPFDITQIQVKLYAFGTEFVSRSEAKRILERLESFSRIILDFDNVVGVGQGFVDQIFRVFSNQHPNIEIEYSNANEVIEFMIQRTQSEVRMIQKTIDINTK